MAWTTVPKPSVDTFTLQNFPGAQIYDDATVTYDDANTYYDTVNYNAYSFPENPSVSWNLARASKVAQFNVSAQTSRPECLFFKTDGSIMYSSDASAGGGNLGQILYQYSLATPWDVTTATFIKSFSVAANITYADSLYIRSDGLKLYIADSLGGFYHEYDFGTAWDIATLTHLRQITGALFIGGIYLTPDGATMYSAGYFSDNLTKYSLTIPWNISTISIGVSVSLAGQISGADGIFFKSDGTKFYATNTNAPSEVVEYNLIIPWDITTLAFSQKLIISNSNIGSFAIFFRDDGLRCYVLITTFPGIYQYNFSEQYTYIAKPT